MKVSKDSITDAAQELIEAMNRGGSAQYLRYLDTASKFHNYSFGNQLLIASQMPNATRVAGYRTWLKLGRQVRKGEHALSILAPRIAKKREEDLTEKKSLYFVSVPVFDVSQTDGEELPTFFSKIAGSAESALAAIKSAIAASGITLVYSDALGGAQGTSAGGKITMLTDLPQINEFLVLLHEFAHELMHWGEDRPSFTRQDKEVQAESVAYIVAKHFGIESPFAADYLINWGKTADTLKKSLTLISKVSKSIIEKMEPAKMAEEEESEAA